MADKTSPLIGAIGLPLLAAYLIWSSHRSASAKGARTDPVSSPSDPTHWDMSMRPQPHAESYEVPYRYERPQPRHVTFPEELSDLLITSHYPRCKLITLNFVSRNHDTSRLQHLELSECTRELDQATPGDSLTVRAAIDDVRNWSLEQLRVLGKGLEHLHAADVQHCCRSLVVLLPTVGPILPHNDCGQILLLSLPKIERLVWKSHRNQLPLIDNSFSRITRMTIHCDMSARDCAFLLSNGANNLIHFTVKTLCLDDTQSVLPIPQDNGRWNRVEMRYLTSLALCATLNPGAMLDRFYMPLLESIDFDIDTVPIRLKNVLPCLEWSTLKSVRLICDHTDADSSWLKKKAKKAIHSHHKRLQTT